MFVDRGEYFEETTLNRYGVKIIYTTKKLGDIRDKKNSDKILDLLNIKNKRIYSGYQTHSANIKIVNEKTSSYYEDTDGFVTNDKNGVIFTKYADCLPIYFYDVDKNIFGCVHSGWQGSYKQIGLEMIKILEKNFKSKKNDIIIIFGISISQKRYEVSEDFYLKFVEKFKKNIINEVFLKKNGKYYFNNQKFNLNMFLDYGIRFENIITNNMCTYDNNFHSYRRDKTVSGRNGAYIYIDKNNE